MCVYAKIRLKYVNTQRFSIFKNICINDALLFIKTTNKHSIDKLIKLVIKIAVNKFNSIDLIFSFDMNMNEKKVM